MGCEPGRVSSGRERKRETRERMNEKRKRLDETVRERQNTERMASVLTQAGSYRAAQTNKLEPYLELEGASAEDDEARGSARRRAQSAGSWNERNGEFRTKFRHCEMTRVVFIAATPAERDATALSASSSFFPGVLTKVSVGLSASRSFVAPFPDITALSSRPSARG